MGITSRAVRVNVHGSGTGSISGEFDDYDQWTEYREIAAGANGTVLTADDSEPLGMIWAELPTGAYAETVGDTSTTSFAVTHSLDTTDVVVQVWDVSGASPVLDDSTVTSITATDADTVTVVFSPAPDTDEFRIVVLASGSAGGALSLDGVEAYLQARQADETSHADDDFFDDASKAFTEVTVSGTAVWTEKYDVASVVFDDQTSGDSAVALWPITSASAPMTIETAFTIAGPRQSFPCIGPCFTDGTTASSNIAIGRLLADTDQPRFFQTGGTLTNFTATTNTEVGNSNLVQFQWRVYVRLIWTAANTFKIQISNDGVSWIDHGSTFSKTMTPTHYGLFVSTHGGSNPMAASFRYFRANAADLSA